jgi:hypothetical protein
VKREKLESEKKGQRCRSCLGETVHFSKAKILNQTVDYLMCSNCSSVQVDSPNWINKVHKKAISNLDTGLVSRCISASKLIATLLFLEGRKLSTGFDWGGGTGLLTRLLRDQGFRVRSYDKYANAEHAEGFEANLQEVCGVGTFISAIECFEHLENPIEAFKKVTREKDYFFFTTEVIDTPPPNPAQLSWWYFLPDTGQHITFVSKNGLKEFRKILGFQYSESLGSLHVFSRKKLRLTTRIFLRTKLIRFILLLFVPLFLNKSFSLAISDKDKLITSK